jgi:hypothetical protein
MYLVEYILLLLDVLTSIAVLPKNVIKFPVYSDFVYLKFPPNWHTIYVMTSKLDFYSSVPPNWCIIYIITSSTVVALHSAEGTIAFGKFTST